MNFRITKEIRNHKYDHDPKTIYGIRDAAGVDTDLSEWKFIYGDKK